MNTVQINILYVNVYSMSGNISRDAILQNKNIYLGVITLGYFGVKILNNLFGGDDKKVNRMEMYDFGATIVMSILLYYFTNFGYKNLESIYYMVGFFAGITFSPVLNTLLNSLTNITGVNYIVYGLLVIISVVLLLMNLTMVDNIIYYALYLIVIVLTVLGLIYTRKKPGMVLTSDEKVKEIDGTSINWNRGIVGWLLALMFVKIGDGLMSDMMLLVNGFLIGMFVSYNSLNGVEYLLQDSSIKADLNNRDVVSYDIDLKESYQTIKWVLALTLIILLIMVILFFIKN